MRFKFEMLEWFKKRTLEEEISIVKKETKKREVTCKNADVAYWWVAYDLNLKQAQDFFMNECLRKKVNQHFGVEE